MNSSFSVMAVIICSLSNAYGLIVVKLTFSSFIFTMIFRARFHASLSILEAQEKTNYRSVKSSLSEYCQILNGVSSLSSYFSRI